MHFYFCENLVNRFLAYRLVNISKFLKCFKMKVLSLIKHRYQFKLMLTEAQNRNFLYFCFQEESEHIHGFYCHFPNKYLISHWYAVHTGLEFALVFIIPYSLIVHNSLRIIITLFKSLRENVQLKEGLNVQ